MREEFNHDPYSIGQHNYLQTHMNYNHNPLDYVHVDHHKKTIMFTQVENNRKFQFNNIEFLSTIRIDSFLWCWNQSGSDTPFANNLKVRLDELSKKYNCPSVASPEWRFGSLISANSETLVLLLSELACLIGGYHSYRAFSTMAGNTVYAFGGEPVVTALKHYELTECALCKRKKSTKISSCNCNE
jgi:hypothetical protein